VKKQPKKTRPEPDEEVTVLGTPRTPVKHKEKEEKEDIAGKSDEGESVREGRDVFCLVSSCIQLNVTSFTNLLVFNNVD